MGAALSIIIVNWHSADFVRRCLCSIRENPPGVPWEEIVIDNASFDGCREMLGREFPGVRFIQADSNLGFAAANNRAAAEAGGEALLFLNPDTEVHPHALDRLVSCLHRHADAGAVGGRILNTDGSPQDTAVLAFPTLWNQFLDSAILRRVFPHLKLWRASALRHTHGNLPGVESISGACLLTRRETFERLGKLNEHFFMYSEDVDFCYIAVRQGLTNYFVADATITHHGGKSSGGGYSRFATIMLAESNLRFFRIRHGTTASVLYRLMIGTRSLSRLPLCLAWFIYPGDRRMAAASTRKALTLLRWTLGLERRWLSAYYPGRS